MSDPVLAVDLFCGAGGTSTGLLRAAGELGLAIKLIAINHWDVAIATHSANHTGVEHRCENLDDVNPRRVVPGGYLDLLVASPECMSHSRARGGTPKNDQSRSTAWHIPRWADALYIKDILIENVPEFVKWGPLGKDGEPIKRLEGKEFLSFVGTLESIGYNVDWRVVNCADYGDPTTRKRLFIQARRDQPICWPEPTHGQTDMLSDKVPYRVAREIIDWSIKSDSVFGRKKPLCDNTMRRILAGLQKYSGLQFSGERGAKIDPFLVMLYGTGSTRSINQPMPTVTAQGEHIALCEPFLVQYHSDKAGAERIQSLDVPLPTVDTFNRFGLCQPFVVALNHGHDDTRSYSLDNPMPTVTSVDAWGIVEPFLVKYNGTGGAMSIDEPLDTVTSHDRFGLVSTLMDGGQYVVDVRFRMLQPHELAAAQGFPSGYLFSGNRSERVKQIGNAVPVNTANALCRSLLRC